MYLRSSELIAERKAVENIQLGASLFSKFVTLHVQWLACIKWFNGPNSLIYPKTRSTHSKVSTAWY